MFDRSIYSAALFLISFNVGALDFSGNVGSEFQIYSETGKYNNQLDNNLTLSAQPKIVQGWNGGNDELAAEFFFRADDQDEERQHADIRELKWLHVAGDHEWRVGVDTVFWGVTESQHLVDVINQTDGLEGFDGEDKLGQAMVHYTAIKDWGVFHVFVMPGFREASFKSESGRLRLPLLVDTSQTTFESADKEHHLDYALRYSHYVGDTEFAFSWFDGTNRSPVLSPALDSDGNPVFVPNYVQMRQFGIDALTLVDDWIWKVEVIMRDQDSGSYTAGTAGFEYNFYGIMDSASDLGVLMEYSWEENDNSAGVMNNDLFAGLRFTFNDVQSTDLLAGFMIDTENHSRTFRVESNRRLGDSYKISAELQLYSDIDSTDPLAAFEKDSHVKLELLSYF